MLSMFFFSFTKKLTALEQSDYFTWACNILVKIYEKNIGGYMYKHYPLTAVTGATAAIVSSVFHDNGR